MLDLTKYSLVDVFLFWTNLDLKWADFLFQSDFILKVENTLKIWNSY